jgi:hypothetical protein
VRDLLEADSARSPVISPLVASASSFGGFRVGFFAVESANLLVGHSRRPRLPMRHRKMLFNVSLQLDKGCIIQLNEAYISVL